MDERTKIINFLFLVNSYTGPAKILEYLVNYILAALLYGSTVLFSVTSF